MTIFLFHVDAFTDKPFAGNPAAICILPAWREDRWLQAVAAEMNLSETAFLVQQPGHFDLRWFTPKVEVDLCGHATLASAHVLWHQGLAKPGEESRFQTRSGILKASVTGDGIELDFPLKPEQPAEPPNGLLEALGVQARYVGRNQFDFLVEVESEAVLRQMTPDFKRLATVQARGIIVTSRSADPKFDFVARFFAPAAGIDEDPVTGISHCCLADFWRKRLGKSDFVAFQASARGGVVKVRVQGDRAFLGGKAVIVARGEWVVNGQERHESLDVPEMQLDESGPGTEGIKRYAQQHLRTDTGVQEAPSGALGPMQLPKENVADSKYPITRWALWWLRADPWPVLLLALGLMVAYFWEYRSPTVAMVGLNYYYDFCFGSFLFGLLAGCRGMQLLVRNFYEARLGVRSGKFRSRRWFWPWLVVIVVATHFMVKSQFPMHFAFLASRSALDRIADEALADPVNAHRLAGRWAGFYFISGVEVIGNTVVLYLGKDRGIYGFARVPGAKSDRIHNSPRQEDDPHHLRDFPKRQDFDEPEGQRISDDWFVMFSLYWLVKVGWS